MSESAATAWIIEHLEIENTKMEEEMGNMETCEDDFGGVGSGTTPFRSSGYHPQVLVDVCLVIYIAPSHWV